MLIVNAGSTMSSRRSGEGWTNTYEGALAEAGRWLERMRTDGFGADIDLIVPDEPVESDGRWLFQFRHRVTGVTVELETHGLDNWEAYTKEYLVGPRVYWNGSSCGNPSLHDFAAPGFVQTFRPEPVTGDTAGGDQR